MDISNRALAMFLLAAIVVSLAGTIISLNKLEGTSTTGFATSGTGNVSLNIQSQLSITTADSALINFGACTPLSGTEAVVASTGGANTSICGGFAVGGADSNISVRNDGNVNANVTIKPDKLGKAQGGTFLDSTSGTSAIAYKTVGGGISPYANGCQSGLVSSYKNFTSTSTAVAACANLTSGATANSFLTHLQIIVPYDVATGQQDVTLTYTATAT